MKMLATFVPDACRRVSDHSLEDDEDRGEVAAGQEGENDGVPRGQRRLSTDSKWTSWGWMISIVAS